MFIVLLEFFQLKVACFLYICPDLIHTHVFNKIHAVTLLDSVLGAGDTTEMK